MQKGLTATSLLIDKLAKALCDAQSEFKPLKQSGKNPHFNSTFSNINDIHDGTNAALAKHGLSVVQLCSGGGEGFICLTTYILHSSGQFLSGEFIMAAKDMTPQSTGSALTYARRYALKAALNLADEDDDGNEAQKTSTKSTSHPQVIKKPHTGIEEVNDYRIGFGKYKGIRLSDIKTSDLINYIRYLHKSADEAGKPLSDTAKNFVLTAESYLEAQENIVPTSPPPSDEDLPF